MSNSNPLISITLLVTICTTVIAASQSLKSVANKYRINDTESLRLRLREFIHNTGSMTDIVLVPVDKHSVIVDGFYMCTTDIVPIDASRVEYNRHTDTYYTNMLYKLVEDDNLTLRQANGYFRVFRPSIVADFRRHK